jgi:hypothetical protein
MGALDNIIPTEFQKTCSSKFLNLASIFTCGRNLYTKRLAYKKALEADPNLLLF